MSKVMISLPEGFLRDIDGIARDEHRSRSELVREAIRTYVVTRPGRRSTLERQAIRRAATRILNARLRLPKGQTAESLVRRARETRYGSAWQTS